MAKFKNLRELCIDQLEDLYDAEKRITKALPKMVEKASSKELSNALEHHLQETKEHVERIEEVFRNLSEEPKGKTCEAIKGIVQEGENVIRDSANEAVCDAGIICAAQRVEHYEMAVYGSVQTWMKRLGENKCADLLQKTLNEEKEADKKLTMIATDQVNERAQSAAA
jgi:ferritin-like metal-binding protein YciE